MSGWKTTWSCFTKKGPTHNLVNYRPIALLNTLYKIVATHAAKHLYEISSFYGLIHKTLDRKKKPKKMFSTLVDCG